MPISAPEASEPHIVYNTGYVRITDTTSCRGTVTDTLTSPDRYRLRVRTWNRGRVAEPFTTSAETEDLAIAVLRQWVGTYASIRRHAPDALEQPSHTNPRSPLTPHLEPGATQTPDTPENS